MKYICKQCGREFEISDGEAQFFRSKGLSLPKRCKECRRENKGAGKTQTTDAKPVRSVAAESGGNGRFTGKNYKLVGSDNSNNTKKKIGAAVAAVIFVLLCIFVPSVIKNSSTPEETSLYTSESYSSVETTGYIDPEDYSETRYSDPNVYSDIYDTQATTGSTNRYSFRNTSRLNEHYQKHGSEVGAVSAQDYLRKANAVIANSGSLSKIEESENDGDRVYFLESTGEIVFLSSDGYIRTYFISDRDYFDRT